MASDAIENVGITRKGDKAHEYRGLAEIQPARIALQAIDALNGKELERRRIEVRRYRYRSLWSRRCNRAGSEAFEAAGSVAPTVERRRSNLKIELVESTSTPLPDADTPATI